MSTFVVKSPVMTAVSTTEFKIPDLNDPNELCKIKLYKGIAFCNGKKVSFHPMSSLSVIIDRLKDYFGLESFDRQLVTFPSQEIYTMESHWGYERALTTEEITEYGVFKIRLFRWIVGLPHAMPRNDIIVRHTNGRKFYVSYRDYEIESDRNMRIEIPPDVNPRAVVSEMLYGITLSILKSEVYDIIINIDPSYIFIADSICRKLNLYGLI